MKTYKVTGSITLSIETEIPAESEEDAIDCVIGDRQGDWDTKLEENLNAEEVKE